MYGEGGNKVNLSDVREKLLMDMAVSGALNLPSALNRAILDGFDTKDFNGSKKQREEQLAKDIVKGEKRW